MAVMVFVFCLHLAAQVNSGAKYENVMAVYIYNFTKFLEWGNNDEENFHIAVLGKNKIAEPLYKIAEKENVNGKKIIVDEIKDISQLKKCSMLFISTEDDNLLPAILKRTAEKKIITISNARGFADKGVCINFVIADEKMKFEINRSAIEQLGIIPSSRLLSLAVKVYQY